MAISDTVQTSSSAFSFGILLQAALGSLFLFYSNNGVAILQDGRRLVLALFLLFAALWAQVDFINLLIPSSSKIGCQATLILSSGFDQLARVAMEQFLLWSVGSGAKLTAGRIVLQVILGIRLMAGGLLVGFTRPEFAPTCVARTSLTPVSIVVIALDFIIIGVLVIRALECGMFRDIRLANAQKERSRALLFSILGFLIWTGTSVIMLLGVSTYLLILRTLLPANGLLILVGIVTFFAAGSLLPRENVATSPGAVSPFMSHSPQARTHFNEPMRDNGSPVLPQNNYKYGSRLFVVNPSLTPQASPAVSQGNVGDTKGFSKLGTSSSMRGMGSSEEDISQTRTGSGYRGSGGNPGSSAAPRIRAVSDEKPRDVMKFAPSAPQKRSLFNWSKQPTAPTVRSLGISGPVMAGEVQDGSEQPFARMQTIDLQTAAALERERREQNAARSRLVATRPAPSPPQEALRKSINLQRKEIAKLSVETMPAYANRVTTGLTVDVRGNSSSASLSPGLQDVRRRSPRATADFSQADIEEISLKKRATVGLPSNPRSNMPVQTKEAEAAPKSQTVMLINDITYNDPGMVKTIIASAPGIYARRPKTAGASPDSYTTTLKSSGSIIHRPRPYRRDSEKETSIFFLGDQYSPKHKRTKSGSSIASRRSFFMSHPGSPMGLPPLPPPPTSAAKLPRLLPNNTKSMTFDEKVQFLFPAPPGQSLKLKRRSSVPSLPRVPSFFLTEVNPADGLVDEPQQSQKSAKRMSLASFGLRDSQIPDSERSSSQITFQSDKGTYATLDAQRALNPEEARKSVGTVYSSTDAASQDYATDWGSIHSKAPAIDLTKATMKASAITIRGDSRPLPPLPLNFEPKEEIMTIMMDAGELQRSTSNASSKRKSSVFEQNEEELTLIIPAPHVVPSWHRRIGDNLLTFSDREQSTRSRKMPPPTPLLLNSKGKVSSVIVRIPELSPIDSPERAIKEIQEQLKRFETSDRGSVGSLLRHMPDALDSAKNNNGGLELLANIEKEMGVQENQWQRMQNSLARDSLSSMISPAASLEQSVTEEASQRSSKIMSRIASRRSRIRASLAASVATTSARSSNNSGASAWQRRLAQAQDQYVENSLIRNGSLNFLSISTAQAQQLGSPTPPDSLESGSELESESDYEEEAVQPAALKFAMQQALWVPPVSAHQTVGPMWAPQAVKSTAQTTIEPPAKQLRPAQRLMVNALQISSVNLWTKPISANKRPLAGLWGSKPTRPTSIVTRRVTQKPQRKSRRVTLLPDIVESPLPLPNERETLGIFQFPWGEKSDSAIYVPPFAPALLVTPAVKPSPAPRLLDQSEDEYSSSFFEDYEDEEEGDFDAQDLDDDFDETTLWEIASMLKPTDMLSRSSLLSVDSNAINDYYETDFESESELDEEDPRSPTEVARSSLVIEPLRTPLKSDFQQSKSDMQLTSAVYSALPQPDPAAEEKYLPEVIDNLRNTTRGSGVLPQLSTEPTLSTDSTDANDASIESISAKISAQIVDMELPATAALMWASQPIPVEDQIAGLFTAKAQRSSFRTTKASPAAKDMTRTPRLSTATSLNISTDNLWAAETPKLATEWISMSLFTTITSKMWVPVKKAEASHTTGLFVKSDRSDYRSTTLSPAAVNMPLKSRATRAPLAQLKSNQLWARCQSSEDDHHWISESSIRPESPSVYSASSSGQSSPASESSSPISTSTRASSIWGSLRTVAKPVNWNSNGPEKSPISSPVEQENMFKSLLRKTSKPTLQPVRESRILETRDMWEQMAPKLNPIPTKKMRNSTVPMPVAPKTSNVTVAARTVLSATPVAHLPTISTQQSEKLWAPEAAATTSTSGFTVASSEMFTHIGPASTKRSTARSEALPRLSSSALFTARPETVEQTNWLVTSAPAPTAQASENKMWNPISNDAPVVNFTVASTTMFSHLKHTETKRPIARSEPLPQLTSQKLFTFESNTTVARNWLHTSTPKPVESVPKLSSVSKPDNTMWSSSTKTATEVSYTVASTAMFSHLKPTGTKRAVSRPEPLSRLTSNELFAPTSKTNVSRDWLHSVVHAPAVEGLSSAVASTSASVPEMWTAPSTITSQPSFTVATSSMFSHLKTSQTKRVASRPANLLRIQSDELFTLSTTNKATASKNWLESNSISTSTSASSEVTKPSLIRSHTWTAPAAPITSRSSGVPQVWSPTTSRASIFLNPHSLPWNRTAAKEVAEEVDFDNSAEAEMWTTQSKMPRSPIHWLAGNYYVPGLE